MDEKPCIQIQGPEYVIRSSGYGISRWDLYLLKVVNKGKENQKYEFKPAGYAMSLESCLKDIINYRTLIRSKSLGKGGDEDLKKIMKIWIEEKTKLLSILNLNEKEWSALSSIKKIPLEQLKQRDLIEAEIVEAPDEEDNEETEETENQD
jgi:hypothetical protein